MYNVKYFLNLASLTNLTLFYFRWGFGTVKSMSWNIRNVLDFQALLIIYHFKENSIGNSTIIKLYSGIP